MKFKVGDRVTYNFKENDIKIRGTGKIKYIDLFTWVTLEKRHIAIVRSIGYSAIDGIIPFDREELEEDYFPDLLKKAKEIRKLGERIIKE